MAQMMKISEWVHINVPERLRKAWWYQMKKWDQQATSDTFYDTDVLSNMLKYAEKM